MQKIDQDLKTISHSLYEFRKSSQKNEILERLSTALEEFSSDLKASSLNLSPILKQKSITLLTDLERELDKLTIQKTAEIKEKILTLKEQFVLKIAFLSDLDGTDHNSAIFSRAEVLFENKVPFVTTRSLLKGSLNYTESWVSRHFEQKILSHQSEWEIFEYENSKTHGDFLIFIPKSICKEKKGREKLKALDFNEKKIKSINAAEALNGTKYPTNPDISEFIGLFKETATIDKLFYIAGHGGKTSIAGLDLPKYQSFLQFLNKQRCKGLLVTSCYAGGLNALIHLPQKNADKCHFPIVVQSIGDFTTMRVEAENELGKRLDLIAAYGQTMSRLREGLDELEKGKSHLFTNQAQICFPQTGNASYGFRAIGEGNHILTVNQLRTQRFSDQPDGIEIEDKEFLLIYPTIVDQDIHFDTEDSILLSSMPGDAAHYIQAIHLFFDSPEEYLSKNINQFKINNLCTNKIFFISKLKGKNKDALREEIFENVALYFSESHAYYIYQKDNRCYYNDKNGHHEITPFQYANLLKRFSTPGEHQEAKSPKSSLLTSCGMGNLGSFIKTVRSKVNLPDFDEYFRTQQSTDKLLQLFDKLTEKEGSDYLFYLIYQNRSDDVYSILKKRNIDPTHLKDLNEQSLLHILIGKEKFSGADYKLIDLLVEKIGAMVNVCDPVSEETLLHTAIQKDDKKIFEILLASPNIEINNPNKLEVLPITYALGKPDMWTQLISKGAKITDLAWLLQTKRPIGDVETFLNAGIDPNLGRPSPSFWASINGDMDVLELFLRRGATPHKKKIGYGFELPGIVLRVDAQIVKHLLSLEGCDIDQEDSKGKNCLLTALQRGDDEIIQILLDKGAQLPKSKTPHQHLDLIIKKLKLVNNNALIEKFLASDYFQSELINIFLKDDPEFLIELLNKGLIDLNKNSSAYFKNICKCITEKRENQQRYLPLLETMLTGGVDADSMRAALDDAVSNQNIELLLLLLQAGAVPEPSLYGEIIRLGDLDCIQLAFKNLEDKSQLLIPAIDVITISDPERKIFQWFLEQGADVNHAAGKFTPTPFLCAISSADLQLVKLCLEYGAKVNVEKGQCPLYKAACYLDQDPEAKIFKLLIEKGGNLNKEIFSYASVFAKVIESKNLDLIKWCIEHGAKIDFEQTEGKITSIEAATRVEDDPDGKVLKFLLEAGANPFAMCSDGNPLIVHAIGLGNPQIVADLFGKGATLKKSSEIDAAYEKAIQMGSIEILSLLKEKGLPFNPNLQLKEEVIFRGYRKGGHQLLEALAELNFNFLSMTQNEIKYLINRIIGNSDLKAMIILENSGIELDIENLLVNKSELLFPELFDMFVHLLERIEPEKRKQVIKRAQLLSHAAGCQNKDAVKHLLNMGADPNLIYLNEDYPVLKAISSGDAEILDLLLQHGANIFVKSNCISRLEKNAIQFAKMTNNPAILKIVREATKKKLHQ